MIRHTFLGPVTLAKRQEWTNCTLRSGINAWLPKTVTWELVPLRGKKCIDALGTLKNSRCPSVAPVFLKVTNRRIKS